ncbi:NAD(P)H-flavin reductase/hemoglobin-like flavoprotein [Kitasatospora sp. MAP12-15]|uniref:globin domain-containing protein n=1 Tax=unclassified Kitasatospora TaxID=2633591 RepID=UPI00247412E8|nr:globin domain-containing protein [Kitasatospora sp. MAP12-44]MDH6108645.1 NAD(P)H-flavin reductase/hemoglobin-like flavoprotein [Kitasatospora sp. MAP12-44]
MKFRANHSTGGVATEAAPQDDRPSAPTVELPEPGQLLTVREIALIRASVAAVEPYAAELPRFFYATLFDRYPQVRELFPVQMDVQHDRLLRALLLIVELVDDPENLVTFCTNLGRDHRKFGTLSGHYAAVGECLLATLGHYAGEAWTGEVAGAWSRAYNAAAQAMDRAAVEDAQYRPAVWQARVVDHRRHSGDLAEITVRTDQPYPFTGGQFVSMETPWWPKTWRYYSPSHAPRPDGSITFQVRAVTGGRVSNSLVRRAVVGDVLRLGAPLGDMTLDTRSRRGVVCVAGGTGLAPIRALIEQAALDGLQRPVDLFVGARSLEELYALDDLYQLSQRHPWLAIRAAVADEQAAGTVDGDQLLKAVARCGPWPQHDAYLAGPGPLIVAAARILYRGGIPLERLHHDPFVSLDEVESS